MKSGRYKYIRNIVLMEILLNDPARLQTRTVLPKKGKGRKDRPRNKKWDPSDQFAY
jgi:hypothetical protein